MGKIDLTSGGWAMFRDDLDEITNRERRSLTLAYDTDGSDIAKGEAVTDALIRLLVTGWSYEFAVPRDNPDALLDIKGKDYDILMHEAGKLEKQMYMDFGPDPKDPKKRPTSP